MTARRIELLAMVAMIAVICILGWQLDRTRDRDLKARAELQDVKLKAAGWEATATASQDELARAVPALKAQLEAARKAKATVAGTSHWEGSGAEIAIPCTVTMGPPAGNMSPTSGSSAPPTSLPEAPPAVAVTPHVKIDDAVAIDDAGGIFVARKVQAQLTVGTSWASAWEDIVADPGSTTKVAPELEKAWKAYRNPPPRIAFVRSPRQWRAGLFLGPALTVGIDGKVGVGLAVGWGIAF